MVGGGASAVGGDVNDDDVGVVDGDANDDGDAKGDGDGDGDVKGRNARSRSGAFSRAEDLDGASAQRIAEREARYGTWLPAGRPDSGEDESAETAGEEAVRVWVGTPLRVVRGLDRATIDLRNNLAYDGLLVSDRDLTVKRNAGRAPRGALPRGSARPCRRRRGPGLRRRLPT